MPRSAQRRHGVDGADRFACSRALVQQQHERVLALTTNYCQRARRGEGDPILGRSAASRTLLTACLRAARRKVGGTSSDMACRTHTHLSALSASSLALSNCGQTLAVLCPQGATPACYLSCPPCCLPQRSVFAETREERLSVSASAFAHRRETFSFTAEIIVSAYKCSSACRFLSPSFLHSVNCRIACLSVC